MIFIWSTAEHRTTGDTALLNTLENIKTLAKASQWLNAYFRALVFSPTLLSKKALLCFAFRYCCSVAKPCLTLCDPVNCNTPGFPVLHHLLEFAQTHVHWVDVAIQPSHLLPPHSPPALSLSQHQGLFQWVGSSHQGAKVLELQLQYHSFQWIFRIDYL